MTALRIAIFAAAFAFAVAPLAQTHAQDDAAFDARVRAQIERMIEEGAFDGAIRRGIQNYVRERRAAANDPRAKLARMRAVDPARDHILGDASAPVTLVEYSDFECPFCKRFHPVVAQLLRENPGQIRWVYRHLPLSFHNPGAERQAEASECVAELGGNDAFWKFTDEIYARTRAGGNGFPLDQLLPLAEEVGVRAASFSQCMQSGRMRARVQADAENAQAIGITGTPGGVLFHRDGGVEFFAGALQLDELRQLVERVSK